MAGGRPRLGGVDRRPEPAVPPVAGADSGIPGGVAGAGAERRRHPLNAPRSCRCPGAGGRRAGRGGAGQRPAARR